MVADSKITYRRATLADIDHLAAHHRMMFEEMRKGDDNSPRETCCSPTDHLLPFPPARQDAPVPSPDFDLLEAAQREKLQQQMPRELCIPWLAEYRNRAVASGCVTITATVPVPEDPRTETAFLHSVYTVPAMRGQGMASTILDHLLAECRAKKINRVQLNASEIGRGIYVKKGFQPLDRVMILWL